MDSTSLVGKASPNILNSIYDPKALFYLRTSTFPSEDIEAALVTIYLWAVKIENTVQKQYGDGDGNGHDGGLGQAWERSSYRAKLADFLAKMTPWMFAGATDINHMALKIEGSYTHDKQQLSDAIRDYLVNYTPEIPEVKLSCLISCIADTALVLGQKVAKPLRFALVMPVTETITAPKIRIITFLFERVEDEQQVKVSRSLYTCSVNLKLFQDQSFEQKEIDQGEGIEYFIMLNRADDLSA
ncbi:hypothetical protein NHJ13051_009637 [Beauveria bassiana]